MEMGHFSGCLEFVCVAMAFWKEMVHPSGCSEIHLCSCGLLEGTYVVQRAFSNHCIPLAFWKELRHFNDNSEVQGPPVTIWKDLTHSSSC